eukprot:9663448-Alexandrium_andersonii.AAC.1
MRGERAGPRARSADPAPSGWCLLVAPRSEVCRAGALCSVAAPQDGGSPAVGSASSPRVAPD